MSISHDGKYTPPTGILSTAYLRLRQTTTRRQRWGLGGLVTLLGAIYLRKLASRPIIQYSIPPDVHLSHCQEWSLTSSSPNNLASWDLDVSSTPKLLFLSKGFGLDGQLTVSQPAYYEGDKVKITISTRSYLSDFNPDKILESLGIPVNQRSYLPPGDFTVDSDELFVRANDNQPGTGGWRRIPKGLLDNAKVCRVTRGSDSGVGFGIFSHFVEDPHLLPTILPPSRFFISVELPLHRGGNKPLSLETNLPHFFHHIYGNQMVLKDVKLESQASEIYVESLLSAETVNITTAYAQISGSFHVNSSIILQTNNASINARLDLYNEDIRQATTAKLHTSNGAIALSGNLTTASGASGGNFSVVSETTGYHFGFSKINVRVDESPINSILTLDVSTTGPGDDINVYTPPAYQGIFAIESPTGNKPRVYSEPDAEDPSGKNAIRTIAVTRDSPNPTHLLNHAKGSTWWDKEGRSLGTIHLRTTNRASVNLHL